MRFQYKHPKIYDFLIKFIYSKKLMDKFSLEVGNHQSVFDVAAGYGRVAKFIDPSNSYRGIDLNEIFVKHGQNKGLHLEIKNIFDESSYARSDVLTLVDVVHHMTKEQLSELFDLIFEYTNKKVVIIEPAFVNLSARYGVSGKLVDWFFKTMDYDGFNKIERWFTNEEYSELFQGRFGSENGKNFSVQQDMVSNHHLVTFIKSN